MAKLNTEADYSCSGEVLAQRAAGAASGWCSMRPVQHAAGAARGRCSMRPVVKLLRKPLDSMCIEFMF